MFLFIVFDFPIGQYILSLNGHNVATAKFNVDTNCYEFDFVKYQSDELKLWISFAHHEHEPTIINREKYVNLQRFDSIRIIHTTQQPLNQMHKITLSGYFPEHVTIDGQDKLNYTLMSQTINVFPHNTYDVFIGLPTESIDIFTDNVNGKIIAFLNCNEKCSKTCYDIVDFDQKHYGSIRLKMHNPTHRYEDKSSAYLSSEINANVINFGSAYLHLSTVDCKITKIIQHCFVSYHYPDRTRLFTEFNAQNHPV